jgi:chemotaxis protein histidine kinase CheA
MDVVRTNIEQLGGVVDIENWEGKGTTIRMILPRILMSGLKSTSA